MSTFSGRQLRTPFDSIWSYKGLYYLQYANNNNISQPIQWTVGDPSMYDTIENANNTYHRVRGVWINEI